MTLEGPQNCGA